MVLDIRAIQRITAAVEHLDAGLDVSDPSNDLFMLVADVTVALKLPLLIAGDNTLDYRICGAVDELNTASLGALQ